MKPDANKTPARYSTTSAPFHRMLGYAKQPLRDEVISQANGLEQTGFGAGFLIGQILRDEPSTRFASSRAPCCT